MIVIAQLAMCKADGTWKKRRVKFDIECDENGPTDGEVWEAAHDKVKNPRTTHRYTAVGLIEWEAVGNVYWEPQ